MCSHDTCTACRSIGARALAIGTTAGRDREDARRASSYRCRLGGRAYSSARGADSIVAAGRRVADELHDLLGLYLGDGCLSPHPRGVFKLRITLDKRYPGVVAECEGAMGEVMPASRVCIRMTPDNCFEVYSYSKRWPLLFPQHGAGKKHLRPIVLEEWQRELVACSPHLLLRGLIHSDGCRFINTGRAWSHPRYAFSNRSTDILAIFCDACDHMGVRWTTAPHTVYVSRKADVARLDEVIGPKA